MGSSPQRVRCAPRRVAPSVRRLRRFLLPYQLGWVRDNHRMKLCEKSRRIGWTYISSLRRVYRALRAPRHDAWWVTRDLGTAREFIRYCRQWATTCRAIGLRRLGDCAPAGARAAGARTHALAFANGSRITALSSAPDALAGKGGDIGLDEFALHRHQDLLYTVARPATMWGHQLEIVSTHRASTTLFNRLCAGARSGRDPQWHHYRVTIEDAVAGGLVERVNARVVHRGGAPLSTAAFLAQERAGCLSEAMWRQEYLCEPQDSEAALLSYALITACESEWAALRAGAADGPGYLGMDIGREHDLTVLWVVERLGDVLYTRAVEVLERAPFQAQLEALTLLWRRARVQRGAVDAGGMGAMLAEQAAARLGGHRLEAVRISAPVQEALALNVLRHCQERTVRLPAEPVIRHDLHQVQRQVTIGGHVRYQAPRTGAGHADRFWALALALHAAGLPGGRVDGMRLPALRDEPPAAEDDHRRDRGW